MDMEMAKQSFFRNWFGIVQLISNHFKMDGGIPGAHTSYNRGSNYGLH